LTEGKWNWFYPILTGNYFVISISELPYTKVLIVHTVIHMCAQKTKHSFLSSYFYKHDSIGAKFNLKNTFDWTADRLQRRGLPHPAACPLCDQEPESIQHLLLGCVVTHEVWAWA
jgi:hypothetical protein